MYERKNTCSTEDIYQRVKLKEGVIEYKLNFPNNPKRMFVLHVWQYKQYLNIITNLILYKTGLFKKPEAILNNIKDKQFFFFVIMVFQVMFPKVVNFKGSSDAVHFKYWLMHNITWYHLIMVHIKGLEFVVSKAESNKR